MLRGKRILMVAAENGALPGAKVGGVGDVIRDIPIALVAEGYEVHVVLPSYGYLHNLPEASIKGTYNIQFSSSTEKVTAYQLRQQENQSSVYQWILDHPGFSPYGAGKIYCDDPSHSPFATDATKYARFCMAVVEALENKLFPCPDIIHLHDWHAAFVLVLRHLLPELAVLKSISTVYSIHNLSLQGVRPFSGHASSFEAWYPQLKYDPQEICDPIFKNCFNPMRAGIVLADKVHTVSPTYAKEIQKPSHVAEGIYGGEGLEEDLGKVEKTNSLVGILNGCEYPSGKSYKAWAKSRLIASIEENLLSWIGQNQWVGSVHLIAGNRLQEWQNNKNKGFLITSVGRITEQKVRLLREPIETQISVLEILLEILGDRGRLLMLGSGDKHYEQFLMQVSANHKNFIFLNSYSEKLAETLYNSGDLFLMPSSFEPCGISQMLAMRSGQPCLVHGIGGLNDTVKHKKNGFVFWGSNIEEKKKNLIDVFKNVLDLKDHFPKEYKKIGVQAKATRFTWKESVQLYKKYLYK